MNTILLAVITTVIIGVNALVAIYAIGGVLRYIQLRFTEE